MTTTTSERSKRWCGRLSRIVHVALFGAGALLLVHCPKLGRPQPGAPCKVDGAGYCQDESTMVACSDGKMRMQKCRGPKGCASEGQLMACDETLAVVGEPCAGTSAACSKDKQSLLICRNDAYVLSASCGGGCVPNELFPKCEAPVAAPGSACSVLADAACSADGKDRLSCKNGTHKDATFVVTGHCRGAKGCKPSKDQLEGVKCDMGAGNAGDVCFSGDHACSGDGKHALNCATAEGELIGTLSNRETCRAGAKCKVDSLISYCE